MSESRRLQMALCDDGPDRYWEISMSTGHYRVRKIVKTADGYYAMPYMKIRKDQIFQALRGEIHYKYSWKNKLTRIDYDPEKGLEDR